MDDDLWHVRIAPDEVKRLTLEQLDDLFRLEVIEADTLIWQPGMTEWLPLSIVAGLDDEGAETEKVSIPVSAPPPPPKAMAQTATAWPPRAPAPASSWPPPKAWSNPPRPAPAPVGWSNPPPRPSVSPYASTVTEPARSVPPPSAVPRAAVQPFASPSMPAPFASPPSTAPLARSQADRRGGGGGGWVLVLALAAGAAVTLYRNDLVHAAARSVGREATFLQLEQALGGPGFGTPRAVEQMAAAAAALTATSETPSLAPTKTSTTATSPSEPSAEATAATTSLHGGDAPSAATTAPAEPASTTVNAPAKPIAPKPAAALQHAAPAHAAPAHASRTADSVDPVFKAPKKGKKAQGSEYDPLNPSL
jgi:GYF domain 2